MIRSRSEADITGFSCEADSTGCSAGDSLRPGADAGVSAGKGGGASSRSSLPNVFIAR